MVKRFAKDNALSEDQFRLLVNASERSPQSVIDTFLILIMGILGLRVAEVTHMTRRWIDFANKLLKIPDHQPCCCTYCIKQTNEENVGY